MVVDTITTPMGDARITVRPAPAERRSTLVLGHGAGGGIEAPDLVAMADALPLVGISVVLVEQPWRVAGRRVASAPASLDVAWIAVLTALNLPGPVVVDGRSAGARVACRTALAVGAVGVVALAFPLHPPGRPERSRLLELEACEVPTLVVQGERDPFGGPMAFPRERSSYDVHPVPGADHSFRVTKAYNRDVTLAGLAATVGDWLLSL